MTPATTSVATRTGVPSGRAGRTRVLTDLPHHDGSPLYVSTLHPSLGSTVSVRLRVPRGFAQLRVVRVRSNPAA